jgi:hypothetical protein
MERSENKTKKKRKIAIIFASKQNKAKRKRKTPIIFASKRNEAKQKRKMPLFSLQSEMEAKIFCFDAKKSVFLLVFESEAKRK